MGDRDLTGGSGAQPARATGKASDIVVEVGD